MTPQDMENDRQLDELLQRIGPSLSEPTASDDVRAKLDQILAAGGAVNGRTSRASAQAGPGGLLSSQPSPRQLRLVTWAAIGMAAGVVGLGITVYQSRSEIASLRDDIRRLQIAQASERDDLRDFRPAFDSGAVLPPLDHPRFIVVNMHHQFCPRAAKVTPAFKELQERHKGEKVLFVTFDVTAASLADTMKLADQLGIKWVFDDPGLETGMVKLVDTQEHRVVLAALGQSELSKLESALHREISPVKK